MGSSSSFHVNLFPIMGTFYSSVSQRFFPHVTTYVHDSLICGGTQYFGIYSALTLFLALFINKESYSNHCVLSMSVMFVLHVFVLLVCACCVSLTLIHKPNSDIKASFSSSPLSFFRIMAHAHFLQCKSTSKCRSEFQHNESIFSKYPAVLPPFQSHSCSQNRHMSASL